MPMMISPTAAVCRKRRARMPPSRPASTMMASCSRIKNSSDSLFETIVLDHAAVDGDDLTGDVAGRIARQECDQVRHLIGAAATLHRQQSRNARGIEVRGAHVAVDDAGCHGVDGNAAARELEGQRAGGGVDRALGGGIGDLAPGGGPWGARRG